MECMIPNKSNFKFQELTPITGVKPYVIRYWETEFSEISPLSSETGEKIYSRSDVEAILLIKNLLFDMKLSIAEAKNHLSHVPAQQFASQEEIVLNTKNEMLPILNEALDFIKQIKVKRNWL